MNVFSRLLFLETSRRSRCCVSYYSHRRFFFRSIVSIFFHERGQVGRCKSDSAHVRELACELFAVFSLDVMGLRESRDIIGPEFGAHDRVLI